MRLRNSGFSDGLDILVLGLLTALRKDSALWSFQVGHQLEELDAAAREAANAEAQTTVNTPIADLLSPVESPSTCSRAATSLESKTL